MKTVLGLLIGGSMAFHSLFAFADSRLPPPMPAAQFHSPEKVDVAPVAPAHELIVVLPDHGPVPATRPKPARKVAHAHKRKPAHNDQLIGRIAPVGFVVSIRISL